MIGKEKLTQNIRQLKHIGKSQLEINMAKRKAINKKDELMLDNCEAYQKKYGESQKKAL